MIEAFLPLKLGKYAELQFDCIYRIRNLDEKIIFSEGQSLFWINPHVLFQEMCRSNVQNKQNFLSGTLCKQMGMWENVQQGPGNRKIHKSH